MKTTLNLNDQVLRSAKGRAARDGITLTRFVEDALRARLTDAGSRKPAFRLRLETVTGDEPPNVDISDRDALYDVIASNCSAKPWGASCCRIVCVGVLSG